MASKFKIKIFKPNGVVLNELDLEKGDFAVLDAEPHVVFLDGDGNPVVETNLPFFVEFEGTSTRPNSANYNCPGRVSLFTGKSWIEVKFRYRIKTLGVWWYQISAKKAVVTNLPFHIKHGKAKP